MTATLRRDDVETIRRTAWAIAYLERHPRLRDWSGRGDLALATRVVAAAIGLDDIPRDRQMLEDPARWVFLVGTHPAPQFADALDAARRIVRSGFAEIRASLDAEARNARSSWGTAIDRTIDWWREAARAAAEAAANAAGRIARGAARAAGEGLGEMLEAILPYAIPAVVLYLLISSGRRSEG